MTSKSNPRLFFAQIVFAMLLLIGTPVFAQRTHVISGELSKGDKTFEDGSLLDASLMDLPRGTSAKVTLESADFEMSLSIVAPNGNFISKGTSSKGDGNELTLSVTAEEAGEYKFIVAAQEPGQKGKYNLSVLSSDRALRTLEDADGKPGALKPGALLMPEIIPVPVPMPVPAPTPIPDPVPMPKPDVVPAPSVIPSPQDNNPSGDNAKKTFGVILNKIEESDDPYSQGEGRNDFYRLEIKKGDKVVIVLESDDFKPIILGGYGKGGHHGPNANANWRSEEPHNRAEVAFTSDRDGQFAFAVHADADFKDGGKGAYRLWFSLNGKFLKAPANITAAGGEGAETVIFKRDDVFTKDDAADGDPAPLSKEDAAGGTLVKLDDGSLIALSPTAFVDRVVSHDRKGSKSTKGIDPNAVLGPNDAVKGKQETVYTMGTEGVAVFEFTDNVVVDQEGPDLIIWEDQGNEKITIEISTDGKDWVDIGDRAGAVMPVDIAGRGKEGAQYRFVRITDRGGDTNKEFPGADLDAIAAVFHSNSPLEDKNSNVPPIGAKLEETDARHDGDKYRKDIYEVNVPMGNWLAVTIETDGYEPKLIVGETEVFGSDVDTDADPKNVLQYNPRPVFTDRLVRLEVTSRALWKDIKSESTGYRILIKLNNVTQKPTVKPANNSDLIIVGPGGSGGAGNDIPGGEAMDGKNAGSSGENDEGGKKAVKSGEVRDWSKITLLPLKEGIDSAALARTDQKDADGHYTDYWLLDTGDHDLTKLPSAYIRVISGPTVGNFAGFQPVVRIYNLPNSFPSQTVGDKDGDLVWLRKMADEGFRYEVKSNLTLGDSGKENSKTVVAVTHRFQNSNCVYLMSYSVGKEMKYPFDFGTGGASITASMLSIKDEAKTPTKLFVNTKLFGKNSTVQRFPEKGYYSKSLLPKKWGAADNDAKIQLSDIEEGEIQVLYVGVFNNASGEVGKPLTSVSLPVGDQQKMTSKTGNPDWDVNLISTVRKRVGGNISELYIGQNPFFQLGALIAVTRRGDKLFFTCFCVDGKIKRTARDGNYPTRIRNLAGDYEAKFSERILKPGQSGEFLLKGLGVSNANVSQTDVRFSLKIKNNIKGNEVKEDSDPFYRPEPIGN